MKHSIRKILQSLFVFTLLLQMMEPVAILAERRIIVYENTTGPFYEVDVTENEIVNTPQPEESSDIEVVFETSIPEETEEPTVTIESEEVESTEEEISEEVLQEELIETPVPEESQLPEEMIVETTEEQEEITESIEVIEETETNILAPIEFEEMPSEFTLDVEDGFVYESAVDEHSSVYASTQEEGLKQLVVTDAVINYDTGTEYEMIELGIEEMPSFYGTDENAGWSNTTNTIESYYPMNPNDGITLMVKDEIITVKSLLESAGEPTQQGNQIIYPMEGNINLRYIIQPGLITEDIMIYSSDASSSYDYELIYEGGKIACTENVIAVIDENEELVMYITAPVAYDAAGAETEVALTYENGIMRVSIDEDWMKSEERVYPIVIDPDYRYSSDDFNSSMGIDISVGSNHSAYTWGNLNMAHYNYILPDSLSFHAYIYMGDTPLLKDAYSFYRLKMEHPNLYNLLGGKNIISAKLRLSTADDGKISKSNTIIAKEISSSYNVTNAKYTNLPSGTEISRTSVTSGNWKVVDIDITKYVENYYESPSYTNGKATGSVMLYLSNQRGYAQFHAYEYVCWDQKGWYTPYTIVTYYDGEVSEMTDVDDFTYNVRPFTVSSYEEGILTFNGLGIDGEAPAGSTVNIAVSADGQTVSSQSVSAADAFFRYPDYTEVAGAQSYNDTKTSNYQSTVMSGFEAGKLYTVSLQATKGTTTSTAKTETFQLVEVKSFDMISSIAEYYGVSESQLMSDNNMTDGLVTGGNLIIVRNPQSHAGEEYVVDDLSEDVEKQVVAALAGRDLTCEYGLIPVNLNTGSFLLESSDFSFNVFADEFTFTRTYNSSAAEVTGDFGYGWSYSGNYAVAKGNGGATVLLEDGTRYYFELDETTGKYTNDLTVKYKLEYDTDHFVLKSQDKTIIFNTRGKVSSISDHHGNTTSYTYDGLELATITLPDGKVMTFEYTGGVITKVMMEDDTYVSYGYDTNKNLISFTDQTGVTIHYEYNTTHDMTSWYYASDKKIVQNTYNDSHQLTYQIDGTGAETTIQYFDECTQITDGRNNIQKVYKDGNSWTTKVEYPDENEELKNYVNGLLMSETKENGVSYTYTYDSELYGVLKTSTRNDGYQIIYGYDTNANLTSETHKNNAGTVLLTRSFTYDEHNNLETKTDADGNTTEYTYNAKHQILTEKDELNRITSYDYDENWKVSKKTNPDGTYRTYTYNDDGYLLSETNEFGKVTTHTLSARNQITKITYPDGGTVEYTYDAAGNVLTETNPLGGITTYEYNTNNNVIKKTEDYRDSASSSEKLAVTTYEYDENQNLVKKTDGNGLITEYTYDSRNRVLTETVNSILQVTYTYSKYGIATVTNSRGKVKTNTYDNLGRIEKITDFDGLTIQYTYDVLGRVLTETDKHGVVTSYEYNGEGQITKITTPRSVTVNEYDDAGQLILKQVTADEIIREWNYEYDSMGNLVKETDPEDNVITYVYQSDRLIAKRDQFVDLNDTGTSQQCREVVYTYDNNGNLESETVRKSVLNIENDVVTVVSSSDAVSKDWTYDKAGNILTEKDGNDHTITYAYNVRGDLIKMIEAHEEDETAPVTLYEVDAMGQRIKETRPEIVHDDGTKVTVVTEVVYNSDGTVKEEKVSGKTIKSYAYDGYKNLISETVLGVTTSYDYDEFNRMIKKTDASGLITHYEYDVYSQLIKVSIDDFSTTSDKKVLWEAYAYDNYGQVIREADRYSMSKYYQYYDDGTVKGMKYAASPGDTEPAYASVNATVYENYTYDKLGRLISKTDQSGNVWSYAYDASGNLISETLNGNVKTFEYDLFDRMIKETDRVGKTITWKYDEAGNLIAEIDDEGRAHLYFYTTNNLLSDEYTAENYANYLACTETAKRVISYEYYVDGSVKKQIDGNGHVEQFKYNDQGDVSESIDKKGYLTVNGYDGNLNLTSETKYLNEVKTISIVNSYTYNSLNQMLTSTDGEDNTTTYTYDIFGNVASIKDAENYTETYTYNTLNQIWKTYDKNNRYTVYSYYPGNLVKSVLGWDTGTIYTYDSLYRLDTATDLRNNSTSYDYDSLGRLSSVTNALNQVASYTYDGENQLETMTQPNGTVTTHEYDSHGNIVQTTVSNATTSRFSITQYDSRGNVIKEVNGAGNVTLYEYDGNNQLTKKSVALSVDAAPVIIAEYTYDAYGNVLTEKDGKGNTTTHVYTESEFKKQTTDPEDNVTTYTYDKAGNLKYVQDARGYITEYILDKVGNVEKQTNTANQAEISYEYNGNGQITKITDLDGKEEEYTYDEYGNLIKHKQKDNTEIRRVYDENFNLISEKAYNYINNAVCEEASISSAYTYDALNRLSTVTDSSGTTTFTYDVLGNIASVTRGTEVTSYQYNAYGEKFKVIYPDESEQTYTYDSAGRIASTTANGIIVTYTYDALGNILTETYSNGLLVTKTYDAAGNLVTQKTEKNGTVLSEYTYGYDGNNSLTSETRIVDGVTTTVEHEYDERDELKKTISTVNGDTTTIEYTLSLTGNHAVMIDGTTDGNSEYNDYNQLTEYTSEDGTVTTYQYDARGNRTSESRGLNNTKTYTYDLMNRLISVTDYDGTVITYSYDGLGNRVSETITSNGVTTNIMYVNDYTQEYTEVLSKTTGTAEENYYYAEHRIISDDTIYGYDGLDNVNMTLSTTGSILKKYEYSDYGERNLDSKTEILDNEYGYNGEGHTVDGLQYLRSRYYDPVTGVFISRDTYRGEFSHPLSQNRYTYCNNNPYKYDDPSGHLGIRSQTTIGVFDSDGGGTYTPPQTQTQPLKTLAPVNTNNHGYNAVHIDDVNHGNQVKLPSNSLTLLGNTQPNKTEASGTSEEVEVTGEIESTETGTVTTIVTEPHDNTQPYGVNTETWIDVNAEPVILSAKEKAKILIVIGGLTLASFFGGAVGAAGATLAAKYYGIKTLAETPFLIGVGAATSVGFASPLLTTGAEIVVERQSLEEYAESQGETVDVFVNNLIVKAQSEAMGAMLFETLGYMALAKINSFVSNKKAVNAIDDALSTPSPKKLRKNLIEAGVDVPDYPNAAHHIVAGSSPKAAEARAILLKYSVDINDAANGTFLPTIKDGLEGAYHPSLHTNAYYDKVNKLLSEATCKEDVLDILEYIGDELSNGTFMQ
ncbi:MAG: AHH domain-containing protein [Erysipelotrichaceae bacterium]|nr:AHH domain-containing protein [Erysipelotrichaceae bacterium]